MMEMCKDILNESSLEHDDSFVGSRRGSHDSGVTSGNGQWRQSHVLETYQDPENNAGDRCNGHFTWGSANEPIPSLAEAVNGLREALAAAPERREVDFVQGLAKGTWLPEEDRILVAYVANFGPKQWNNLQAKGLLKRNGKSCRLRWVNQLKPGLQRNMHGKGCKRFTESEERLVIQLQRTTGNRWAQIAKFLPGRTDNDVKNFWNLHIKRLERAKWQHVSMEQTRMEIKVKMEEEDQLAKEGGELGAESDAVVKSVKGGEVSLRDVAGGVGDDGKDSEGKDCISDESEGSRSETIHKESVKPLFPKLPTLSSPGRHPRVKSQPLLHERRKFRLQEVAAVAAEVAGGPPAVTEGVDLNSATLTSLLIGCPQMRSQDINVDDWLKTPTPGASLHAIAPWLVQTSPLHRPFSPMKISPRYLDGSPRGPAAWGLVPDRLSPPSLFPLRSLSPNATALMPSSLFPRRSSNDSTSDSTPFDSPSTTVSEVSPHLRGNPLITPRPSPFEPDVDIHFGPLAIKGDGGGKKSLYHQALMRGGNLSSHLSRPNHDRGMLVDNPKLFGKRRSFSGGGLTSEDGTGVSRSLSSSASHLMLPPLVSEASGGLVEEMSPSLRQASSSAQTSDWGRVGQLVEAWSPLDDHPSPDHHEDQRGKYPRSISCTFPTNHTRSLDRPLGLLAGSAGPPGMQGGGSSGTTAGSSMMSRMSMSKHMPRNIFASDGGTVGDHSNAASCHQQEYSSGLLGGGNLWLPTQLNFCQAPNPNPFSAAPHAPPQQQWSSQHARPATSSFAPAQIRPKVEKGTGARAVEYHWGQAKAARVLETVPTTSMLWKGDGGLRGSTF